MFINMQDKTLEEIEIYKRTLIEEHQMKEFDGFFCIEEFWEEIQNHQKRKEFNYFGVFNDKFVIVSSDITEDSLYKFITGKTKEERIEFIKNECDKYKKDREEYESTINELIPKYKDKFHEVIEKKYWNELDEIIKPCLESIYRTFLLDSVYDVLERNKNNKMTNQEIEKVLEHHGHSGMSYSIVINILSRISSTGKEYKKYIDDKYKLWN